MRSDFQFHLDTARAYRTLAQQFLHSSRKDRLTQFRAKMRQALMCVSMARNARWLERASGYDIRRTLAHPGLFDYERD